MAGIGSELKFKFLPVTFPLSRIQFCNKVHTNLTSKMRSEDEVEERDSRYSESSLFTVSMNGQIERGYFPEFHNVYCKYCYSYGTDWSIIGGSEEGISQIARTGQDEKRLTVWNLPLEVTFSSSNPFGWPQIVVSAYALDAFGNDVIAGYGAVHIPPKPGHHKIKTALFVPESSSLLARFSAWLTGRRPELVDPKVAAQGEGRGVLTVQSQAMVYCDLNVIVKDMKSQGYVIS